MPCYCYLNLESCTSVQCSGFKLRLINKIQCQVWLNICIFIAVCMHVLFCSQRLLAYFRINTNYRFYFLFTYSFLFCRLCELQVKVKYSTTTNLWSHLQCHCHHPEQYTKLKPPVSNAVMTIRLIKAPTNVQKTITEYRLMHTTRKAKTQSFHRGRNPVPCYRYATRTCGTKTGVSKT